MAVIEVNGVTHLYGRTAALRSVQLSVPPGSLYALLGPNGSGKTTLLQILSGLRQPSSGDVRVFGKEVRHLTARDRAMIGYVAEGQRLPDWMTLQQVEAYLAPLYDSWNTALADALRERFGLDPTRRIGTLSRGDRMKAALLCSLAPRPRLLLMDEPFSGIDVAVRDELVRGLLASARSDEWTVVVCSHDIAEVELLADWVGFLDRGRLILSEPLESLQDRFTHVDAFTADAGAITGVPEEWLSVERAGDRISFIVRQDRGARIQPSVGRWLPRSARINARPATLREVFVALARRGTSSFFGQEAVQ